MKINNKNTRSLQAAASKTFIKIIDQTRLPHELIFKDLYSLAEVVEAIKTMQVRGAPLIGVTAAFGLALALKDEASDAYIADVAQQLIEARPTAVNLAWAVNKLTTFLLNNEPKVRFEEAWSFAQQMAEDDVRNNKKIGIHGLQLLRTHKKHKLNIMTHCNAGWLATIDYGTALSPIFLAHEAGLDVHVWFSETRPRNQGMSLTAWELSQAKIPHTIIADNAAGLLMQEGNVDCVLVGADRIAYDGQVVNKIGTYLKALAAFEHNIPFYVAAPISTFDSNFIGEHQPFEIEYRHPNELLMISGKNNQGMMESIEIGSSPALNPAFDLTPAKFITRVICEKGILEPQSMGDLING